MKRESFQPVLDSAFVARALGLSPPKSSHVFPSVTTDSRKVAAGVLFVAIPGEKFDGHDFVAQAITAGAAGVIHRKGFRAPPGAESFEVEDTQEAFRKLAAAWRKAYSLPVLCVAGSVGKTTTKELLAALLEGKWPGQVLKTQGSQNGHLGISMTLLELRPRHGVAVVEVGIDEPGAMVRHMETVAPGFAVLTAIGPEHLEKLRDLPTVAREEGLALSHVADAGGLTAINLDDSWIAPHAASLRGSRKIAFTLRDAKAPAGVDPLRGSLSSDGARLLLQGLGLDGVELPLPLLGDHNASNLLGAVALARGLGLTPDELRRGLAGFRGADGRSQVRELGGGTTVLCDYYNSNPSSLSAGLDLMTRLAQGRARWACLGDMLELGTDEERFHREVAAQLVSLGVEHVLLFGPRMKALLAELRARGRQASHFGTHAELAEALRKGLGANPEAAVLIKGSRGMRMEEVWKALAGAP